MLDGVNDSDEHARQLANLLNRHDAARESEFDPAQSCGSASLSTLSRRRVESFKSILESKGIPAFVRRPRGQDIFAACGQLAARREANPAALRASCHLVLDFRLQS